MKILLIIFIIYTIIAFLFGFLMGLPDNEQSIKNSLIMGIIIVFYPLIMIKKFLRK